MTLCVCSFIIYFFFFQAEDGIRDTSVTGVQTCALPISRRPRHVAGRGRPGGDRARGTSGRGRAARDGGDGRREAGAGERSEERRVGKECGAGWRAAHERKKIEYSEVGAPDQGQRATTRR